MHDKILAVGLDPMLLKSRALILASRDYVCGCASPEETLERLRLEQYSVLLVCSSVSSETAARLINEVRKDYADMDIVRLMAPGAPSVQEPDVDAVVDMDFHPQTWLRAVESIRVNHHARATR